MWPNELRENGPSQHAINCAYARMLKRALLIERMAMLLELLVLCHETGRDARGIIKNAKKVLEEYRK